MSTWLSPARSLRRQATPGTLLRQWWQVGSSTLLGQVLGVVGALAIRMLVSPAAMGIWQACRLVLSYSNYASLGVTKAAARQWAVAVGSGRRDEAQRAAQTAWGFAGAVSLLVGGVVAGLAWWQYASPGDWAATWAAALALVAVAVPLQRWVTFRVGLLRAGQQFQTTASLSVAEAFWCLGLSVLGAWLAGAVGLCGAVLLGLVFSAVFLHVVEAPCPRPRWDPACLKRLLRTGLPLVLGGAAFSLFRSLDKLMLLFYLPQGEFALGCYSAAMLAQGQLFGLGNTLAGVLGPRLAQRWGRTGSRAQVAHAALETTQALALLLAGPAAAAVALGPWVLGLLLPEYQPGLVALPYLACGALALVLALPAQHALVAWDRPRLLLVVVLVASGLLAAGNHVVLNHGGGLQQVAQVTCAVNWLFLLLLSGVAFTRAAGPQALVRLYGDLGWMLLPLWLALAVLPQQGEPALLTLLGVFALWAVVLRRRWPSLRRVLFSREVPPPARRGAKTNPATKVQGTEDERPV